VIFIKKRCLFLFFFGKARAGIWVDEQDAGHARFWLSVLNSTHLSSVMFMPEAGYGNIEDVSHKRLLDCLWLREA
jgi:hypothetical protein